VSIYLKVIAAATLAALVYHFVPASARMGIPVDAVPGLESFLEVVGGIYSVLAAFVIFVVWEQFNALEKLTVREGSLVAEVPRLAGLLGGESSELRHRIAVATRGYLEAAAAEWEELAQLQESRKAVKALDAMETRVGEAATLGEGSAPIYGRLVDAVAALRECRVSRVTAARHRMPATLRHLLLLLSMLLLAAFLALPPGGQPWIGVAAFAALAGVLAMVLAVVWDMDHPFVGVWQVSKTSFENSGKAFS
jgi:Protein of unknown function (DUF4239)